MVRVVEPSVSIDIIHDDIVGKIAHIARTCYQSYEYEGIEGNKRLIIDLKNRRHIPMFDHIMISLRFIMDRGISHELVRHRLAAYAQESTRYCNYIKDKFGSEITVIKPWGISAEEEKIWMSCMEACETAYMTLLGMGMKAQNARDVLPTCLKTEIVMSASITEWFHVFHLRTSEAAHPKMRYLMDWARRLLIEKEPLIFTTLP